MVVEGKHGCRLGCIAILFTSCVSFQNELPRIPISSPGLRWRSHKPPLSKPKRSHASITPRRTFRNLVPYDPSSTSYFPMNMSNETSSNWSSDTNNISINGNETNNFVQNKTNNIKIEENENNNYIEKKTISYTLGISKHYYEVMEDRSGKDYRWIKGKKPVSHVMM